MDINEIKDLLYQGEKADLECKEAEFKVPKSVYETYSSFANTNGGTIILGVRENTKEKGSEKNITITGVEDAQRLVTDFWNTINSSKVNANILIDEDVSVVETDEKQLIVIRVPRTDYKLRPVYISENPFKGTFKRNSEGDYHCSEAEVRAMIRDQNPDGNDGLVLENYTMEAESVSKTPTKTALESTSMSTPKTTPKTTSKCSTSTQKRDGLRTQIVDLLLENSHITRKELAERTGVTLYAVKKELEAMKERNMVKYEGPSKGGQWMLAEPPMKYESQKADGEAGPTVE